jgi:glutathione S-transferase
VAETLFLTLAEAIEIHSDQIHRYGGQAGLRDLALLESVLAQPEASFAGKWLHGDQYEMAAAYAYHLCQNHPFVDEINELRLQPRWCFSNSTASQYWTQEAGSEMR